MSIDNGHSAAAPMFRKHSLETLLIKFRCKLESIRFRISDNRHRLDVRDHSKNLRLKKLFD